MKIYDISLPIRKGMLVWPGQPAVEVETLSTTSGGGAMVSRLSFSSHTGTHIDAPAHFLEGGQTIDQLSPDIFFGKARVFDLTWINLGDPIERAFLEKFEFYEGARILLKTANYKIVHKKEFSTSYVHLSFDAAQYFIERKVRLVGVDYLGIEKKGSPGHPVHSSLLSHGITIVEGLDLEIVPEGEYELYCLPLKIEGIDGAPARAILVDKES